MFKSERFYSQGKLCICTPETGEHAFALHDTMFSLVKEL